MANLTYTDSEGNSFTAKDTPANRAALIEQGYKIKEEVKTLNYTDSSGKSYTAKDTPANRKSLKEQGYTVQDQSKPAVSPQNQSVTSPANFDLDVIKMQEALIKLANTVASHDMGSLTPKAGGEQYNAFNKMFSNKYLSPLADNKIDDFRKFISSITQIGRAGAATPDGIWGEKTTKAVDSARMFGMSLLQMLKDMGVDYKDLTVEELNNDWVAPSVFKHGEDLSSRAPVTTNFIEKIIKVYEYFRDNFLEHDKYKEHFKGKPLLTLSAPKLDPKEEELVKTNANKELPSLMGNSPIRLFDLETLHAFKSLLEKNNIEATPANINANIKRIQEDLEAYEARTNEQVPANPY